MLQDVQSLGLSYNQHGQGEIPSGEVLAQLVGVFGGRVAVILLATQRRRCHGGRRIIIHRRKAPIHGRDMILCDFATLVARLSDLNVAGHAILGSVTISIDRARSLPAGSLHSSFRSSALRLPLSCCHDSGEGVIGETLCHPLPGSPHPGTCRRPLLCRKCVAHVTDLHVMVYAVFGPINDQHGQGEIHSRGVLALFVAVESPLSCCHASEECLMGAGVVSAAAGKSSHLLKFPECKRTSCRRRRHRRPTGQFGHA